tara:strand:+ start:10145 stop:10813 length:669 start_codon:yes stop_codon:yes gene_type:complete
MLQKLTIDIVSDIVCPWCVVGYKNLKVAQRFLKKEITLEINWRPYQLHPEIPPEGIDKKLFFKNKNHFNSPPRDNSKHLIKEGLNHGFIFNFKKPKLVPNTLQSHRLIELTKDLELKSNLAESLFTHHFTHGTNISSKEELLKIAKEIGIEQSLLDKFMNTNDGLETVIKEERSYRERDISGVPTFIINDQYLLQGAQHHETILSFLRRIKIKVENKNREFN